MLKMNKGIKIVVSSLATIFLVFLYWMIFNFSEQDGETSGGLSRMISEKCMEFWNSLSGRNWSETMVKSWALYFENPIRKLAHFCEYALMAVLMFFIWYPWIGLYGNGIVEKPENVRRWKRIPLLAKIIIPWVFVSAAFDEVHQLFVPERWGSFADVLLDTAGGCVGLICCIYGDIILNHLQMRRKRK